MGGFGGERSWRLGYVFLDKGSAFGGVGFGDGEDGLRGREAGEGGGVAGTAGPSAENEDVWDHEWGDDR